MDVVVRLVKSGIVGDLWIDGSFVTDKFNPRDVDLVLCIAADLLDNASAAQSKVFDWFESDTLKSVYRCDGYIVAEWSPYHPLHTEGVATREYWKIFLDVHVTAMKRALQEYDSRAR